MAENNTTKRQKLDTQLECSRCLNTYKEPKILPCFHVFCKSPCLEQLVVTNEQQRSLICPTCNEQVILTEEGISGLQSDFQIDRLFEIDIFNKAATSTDTQCGSCEEGKATGYCQDCEQFVCDECQTVHQKLKLTKTHQIITHDKVQSTATNFTPPRKAVPLCPKHSSEKLKIYCETCQELICSDCTIRLHQGHNFDLVTDVFPKYKEEIVSGLNPVKEKLNKVQQALQAFDTRAKEIHEAEAAIHQQKRLLDQQQIEIVAKLDSLTQQNLKSLAVQRDQVESAQVKLTSCLEYAEGGLEIGTEGEVLAMKGPVLKRLGQINAGLDPASIEPKTKVDTQSMFTDCKEILQKSYEDCLMILEGENPKKDQIRAEAIGNSLTDIDYSVRDNPSLAVAKSLPRSFEKPVRVITNLKRPWKATTNSKGDIIVTESEGNRVSIFTSVGEKIHSFGSKGSQNGQFKTPTGVAVDSDDYIYISEYDGHRIQKFTASGEFLLSVGTKGSGHLQFDSPDGLGYNTTNGKLYVCEEVNDRVQILNTDLTFHSSFGTHGKGKGHLGCPSGVSFDQEGNLYIAEDENHRVQVFTPNGEHVRIFGVHGSGQGRLAKSVDTAISSTGVVYVAEMIDSLPCISMFNTLGECRGSFGRKGTIKGKFKDGATGITIGKDDNVIITDRLNGRIQIF